MFVLGKGWEASLWYVVFVTCTSSNLWLTELIRFSVFAEIRSPRYIVSYGLNDPKSHWSCLLSFYVADVCITRPWKVNHVYVMTIDD